MAKKKEPITLVPLSPGVISIGDEEDSERIPDLLSRSSYTVGFLRNMYILCTDDPEKFAARFNVDSGAIERFVRRGDWELLRERNRSNTVAILQARMMSNIIEMLQNELKQQEILNKASRQKLEEAEEHFQKWGDYFLRRDGIRPTDAVKDPFMRDPFGEKIVIGSVYGILNKDKMIKSQTLIAGLNKMLREITLESVNLVKEHVEPPKQLTSGGNVIDADGVIDLTEFGLKPDKT